MLAGLNGEGLIGRDFWGSGCGGSVQVIDDMRSRCASRSCGLFITLRIGDIKDNFASVAKLWQAPSWKFGNPRVEFP